MKQNVFVEHFVVSFVIQFVKGKKGEKTKHWQNRWEIASRTNSKQTTWKMKWHFPSKKKEKPENDRKVVDKIILEKWVARCGFMAGRQSGSRRLIAFVGWKTWKIKFLSHFFKKHFCRIEKMAKIGKKWKNNLKPHYNTLKGKVIIKKKKWKRKKTEK